MVNIKSLRPRDAAAVARLEKRFHDRALRDGKLRLKALLETVEYERIQHSFGLFDQGRLVGYLLSYGLQDSLLPAPALTNKQCKDAVYIEDVAILESYRRHFVRLFNAFVASVKEQLPRMPIEAIGIEPMVRHWQEQTHWASRMGYKLDQAFPLGETLGRFERWLIRWESLGPPPSTADQRRYALASMDSVDCAVGDRQLTVRALRREEHWDLLETCWDDLLLSTPGHTPFQSYAYQRLWWKHFGDQRLLILLVMDGSHVIGIAPLCLSEDRYLGQRGWTLGFIGSRWEADRPVFLFGEQFEICFRACWYYLWQRRQLWRQAYLYEQIDDERMELVQRLFREAGCLVGILPDSVCPTIQLSGSWEAFIGAKSRKFRKNIQAAQRKLAAFGEIRYEVNSSAHENVMALEIHKTLEARSWKANRAVGISRSDDYFTFYRDMAAVMSSPTRFITRTLWVGEEPVASTFGLLFNRSFFSLQIVHDNAFSKASPGTYLESLEIKECFDSGVREYDFLGGFLNNKSRWTEKNRITYQIFIYQKTPYHVALYIWYFYLKPLIKRCWKQLRFRLRASKPVGNDTPAGEQASST
ncbi:MAG: GNAT family N-acetyltransferase [Gammaproteobacteria bacterium]